MVYNGPKHGMLGGMPTLSFGRSFVRHQCTHTCHEIIMGWDVSRFRILKFLRKGPITYCTIKRTTFVLQSIATTKKETTHTQTVLEIRVS